VISIDNMIIAGKDCDKCQYSLINDSSKSKVVIYCKARDKTYIWGQSIPCEDKKVVRR